MRIVQDLSIRGKLTFIVMLTTFLALVLAAVTLELFDRYRLHRDLLEETSTRAGIVANIVEEALRAGDRRPVEQALDALRADPHLLIATVFDAKGRVFAQHRRKGEADALPMEETPPPSRFLANALEVFHPVWSGGRQIGVVYLKSDLEAIASQGNWRMMVNCIAAIIAVVAAFVFSNRVQRLISRPLLKLAELSRVVKEFRNYSLRGFKESNDELGQFIDTFNDMLAEIQQRDAALQDARTVLERRIWERTRELMDANKQLSVEVVTTRRAREESEVLRNQLEATVEHLRSEAVERIEAQQALRRSEERFFKAFKSSPVPLAILTRKSRTFVDVNDRFADLVGQVREVIIGCTLHDVPLLSVPETRVRLDQLFEKGHPLRNWQCSIGGSAEHPRAAVLSSESLALGAEPCILLMVEDVSERVNLEAKLRQAQKMEAIGQLASGVAHDFNNLLTIIQGHTQLVLSTRACNEKGRGALEKVVNASERAAQLTRQLLTFSRKQVVQLKTLDLNQVVQNISGMLGPLLGENVRLNWKPMQNLPAIEADVGMLEQVIVNLAVNARDAMSRGGDLILSTLVYEIDASYTRCQPQARPGRFVCLQVSDTGCGMDQATLERIFEPFFTTKGVGKGTGLGLATVYGIATQHMGWVEVVSQVGVGTTFNVFLPAADAPATALEGAPDSEKTLGGTETILVVEDEPVLRELVTQVLRDFGYDVMEAPHGKEALNLWQRAEHKPDLLLTDMMMPEGMTGWELAERLRSSAPGLRVVYTSGYSTELFGRNLELGDRTNFLPKPYNPRTLARIVRDCLDN